MKYFLYLKYFHNTKYFQVKIWFQNRRSKYKKQAKGGQAGSPSSLKRMALDSVDQQGGSGLGGPGAGRQAGLIRSVDGPLMSGPEQKLFELSERFENLGHQTLASLARQILSNTDNNPAKTITRLILHYYDDDLRSFLNSQYPNDLYETFNTAERIQTYIKDTLLAGSESLRRVRLFSIGHQGSGKSSLLHSMR